MDLLIKGKRALVTGASLGIGRAVAEELAHEQGVHPINNLAGLTIDWPADESIDEFLALIREVRH